MAICNLLSLTVRKNLNYEPEALTTQAYYNPDAAIAGTVQENDSLSINGRVMDIMGTLTDEQIEAVFKVGYTKAVNDIVEIITTCKDISDQELIDLYFGKANASGAPQRLRIVRTNNTNPETPGGNDPVTPGGDNPETPGGDDPVTPGGDDPETPGGDDPVTPGGDNPETPDTSSDEGDDEDPTLTADYTLKRKCTSGTENCLRENITVDSTGKTFKLTNSVKGKKYKYTISANSGSSATITKIEFLDNDRLLIVGDNLKIVADSGQADNIILMGSNNYIDTGDLGDTVRIGLVQDSISAFQEYWYFEGDSNNAPGYYFNLYHDNIINTGSGNDYVENSGANKIDMGDGNNDYIYDYLDYLQTRNSSYTPKHYENKFKTGTSQTSDYKFGVASQGGYGDCQFLTFMNTFNGKLSDYVTITKQTDGYKVTFKKSGKSAIVYDNEINNVSSELNKLLYKSGTTVVKTEDKENASGDIDNVLLEIAFRKIIENFDGKQYNMDNYKDGEDVKVGSNMYKVYNADKNSNIVYSNPATQYANMFGHGNNNNLISKVFYGTSGSSWYDTENKQWFKDILTAYKSGTITNIIVGTHQDATETEPATGPDNHELGIYYCHAYAIKDFELDKWVEVCNPWDGADRIRLDWGDFFTYYPSLILVGDSYQYMQTMTSTSSIYAGVIENDDELLLNLGGYQSYLKEQEISISSFNPFANIFADSEPTIYDEIDEITSSIEQVKEILEEKKTLELYS